MSVKNIAIAAILLLAGCTQPAKETASSEEKADNICIAVNPESYKTTYVENQQKVYDFLKATGTYYLATTEGDQPRVRPFGTVNIFEGKLYIQTGHKKNVAKQIAANAKVGICAFNGKEWLRVAATLVEDPRIEAKKDMLDHYPNLRSMYDESDDNTAVYFLTNAEAKLSSFGTEDVIFKF